MLHEKGLAYQAKAVVNYDPVDKTVLANEQVRYLKQFLTEVSNRLPRSMRMGAPGGPAQRLRRLS